MDHCAQLTLQTQALDLDALHLVVQQGVRQQAPTQPGGYQHVQGFEIIGGHRHVQAGVQSRHRLLQDAAGIGGLAGQHGRVARQTFQRDTFLIGKRVIVRHHE